MRHVGDAADLPLYSSNEYSLDRVRRIIARAEERTKSSTNWKTNQRIKRLFVDSFQNSLIRCIIPPNTKRSNMILQTLLVGPLGVNCYILGDENTRQAIVIDPGGNA